MRVVRSAVLAVVVMAALDAWLRLTYGGRSTPQDSLCWVFDATREQSVPTWWSVVAMALLGCCCLLRAENGRFWRWPGLGFLYLSCDDACMLHERIGVAAGPSLRGLGVYPWVLLLAPLFLGLGLWIAVPWWRELAGRPGARRCLVAGFTALAMALGIEALEEHVLRSGLSLRGLPLASYDAWLEEFLEMLGPVLLFGALPPLRGDATAPGSLPERVASPPRSSDARG